jgi:LysM repeat protein/ABC-type branched-subunit amino acid transport system substrate-binding protein
MKIINWIKALPILVVILICNTTANSQVIVERSKDKVIISGIPYFIHLVKKGETAYSISRAYGITVEDLTRENPPAVYGLNEGQTLRIPVKLVTEVKPSEPVPAKKEHDENKFIYHSLKPGETVYSLSKSYGVSENEIIQSNPGIDINKLSVGSEIAVPKRAFMSTQQKFDDLEKRYLFHKVLKGESLSSIAREYGLTVRQLRKENRDLRFPQVGDFVRIPGVKTAEIQEIETVKTDTAAAIVEEPLIKIDRHAGFTPVKNLNGSLNVAVLLPFYLAENSKRTEIDSSTQTKGKKTFKLNKMQEDWIYPASLDFLEMYEGILLASDTLCSLGLNINLQTYDIKSDTIEITKLIRSGRLADMNLIIGPVYSHNLSIVSEYARNLGIPVVSPVPLMNNSALINNPTLFMANSSLEIAQKALAKKISEYWDNNIVFIHADSLGVDEDVKRFKNLIFKELSYKLPYEDIKFKEFLFYSRSMFNNDSINRLSHTLSEQSKNIVIIASEEAPVISEIIDELSGLYRKYDIKLFGYPVIRDLDRLEQKELFDIDIMVYSPYWIDYSKNDVKQFNSNFKQKFLTEPLEKSYAWQGYDIAYYFLSGLAMYGKNFIMHPEIHYPDLLQSEYDFKRKNPGDGFENQKLFMIRYTKDYEVKSVDEIDSFQQK